MHGSGTQDKHKNLLDATEIRRNLVYKNAETSYFRVYPLKRQLNELHKPHHTTNDRQATTHTAKLTAKVLLFE